MAWNEPGGNKDKDPWGSRNKQDGPPDLEELVKKMQDKFGGIFGGKKGGGKGRGGSSSPLGIGMIMIIILVGWIISGIYIVDPAERGVILQFGKYQSTVGPGPHWILRPIQTVEKVNVDEVRESTHKAQMLTKDENLLQIEMAVQYQVKNAENFLFNVREPEYTLEEAAESALREVVGAKRLDDILSVIGGREVLVNETEKIIQDIVDRYKTGLRITKANLKSTQPPQEVQNAFEDAIKAREDEDRYKKQAEAYERDIIPKAEGDVQRLAEESEAYKQQVIEKAKGETSRFLQTYKEYKKAPEITRKRLYIETMEAVLSNSSKVMIKLSQGNSLLYLPLDKIINQGTRAVDPSLLNGAERNVSSSTMQQRVPGGSDIRRREGR